MKKSYIYIIIAAISLSSCVKNVLNKQDLTGLGTEIWSNESEANLYLNRCYSVIMPNWPANAGTATLPFATHNTTDDYNTTGSAPILFGTLGVDGVTDFAVSATSNTGTWYSIRRLNILFDGVDKGNLPAAVKTNIKAQAYFLRAYIYFQLVKLYGGVPIITTPQDWNNDELLVPRNKSSECIDFICRDLDSAALAPAVIQANYTSGSGNRGRITKAAALAFKGRVLLNWASAQFNSTNDAARWQRAYQANKMAYDTLVAEGHALYPTFSGILTDESSANKEVIILRSYDGSITSGNFNSYENLARASSEGGGGNYQPTWNLVQAFPMKNGLQPFNANGSVNTASGYDSVYFWRNRDPRFDATVVYNGVVWALSGQTQRRQWMYTGTNSETTVSATGFYSRKGVNTATSKLNAVNGGTDWIEMRFAEVMLNLAECANATGNPTEAYAMMTAIRKRAGIDAGTGSLYGLKAGMPPTEMLLAILNERRIEFAFEGKRYDDLRRTKLWSTINGSFRKKLTLAPKGGSYTAASLNAFVPGTATYVRDTINLNSDSYSKIFTPTISNLETTPINFLDSYYFYGIPTTHLTKDPNMKQNAAWGGTFDPLQ